MMGASDVLLAVASELSALAKSNLPEIQEGEVVKREWLEDGRYFRETVHEGKTCLVWYDFRQRKSHVSGERECIEPLRWLETLKDVTAVAAFTAVALYAMPADKAKPVQKPVMVVKIQEPLEPIPQAQPRWSEEDVRAMALTLAGECYSDKVQDKRLVCEVILNRVSDSRFKDSVVEVLETPNAFNGYWQQSRPVTENDIAVAEQTLADWHDNGCQPLSDIRFFCSGGNRENHFY